MVSKGRAAAYKQTHARILLLSDENQSDGPMTGQEIGRDLRVCTATVEQVRRRCAEESIEGIWNANGSSTAAGKSWKARVKPTRWPWPAPNHWRDGSVGRCNCWPTDWWSGR